MAFLTKMFDRIFKWQKFKPPKTMEERLSWMVQPYLGTLEDIVLWRNSTLSLCIMGAVNILFFLVSYLHVRILGLAFTMAAIAVILEGIAGWLSRKEISPRRMVVPQSRGEKLSTFLVEARQWLSTKGEWLLLLREENPAKFFMVASTLLGCMVCLGRMVSGATLLYFLAMAILVLPKLIPHLIKMTESLRRHTDSDEELEGFIPEMTTQAMCELSKIDQPTSLDTVGDSWLPKETIPEVEESSESSEDEFIRKILPKKAEENNLQSSVTVAPQSPDRTWTTDAIGALSTLGGALGALLPGSPGQTLSKPTGYQKIANEDSDFEFVDADDLSF